jgi:fumarylacetoacetate (FAA) hydrolase family protein
MGTQSDSQPISDIEIVVQQSRKYTEIFHEYCTLASQQTLTEMQADRLEKILQKAQSDTWLDFLIDEADHILAHELGLIKEKAIQHQLHELKKSLDRIWCERIIQEIQKQNRSKKIQKYLQEEGLYDGAIDGYIGPRTQTALELLKKQKSHSFPFGADCF